MVKNCSKDFSPDTNCWHRVLKRFWCTIVVLLTLFGAGWPCWLLYIFVSTSAASFCRHSITVQSGGLLWPTRSWSRCSMIHTCCLYDVGLSWSPREHFRSEVRILEQFYGTSWYPLHQLQLCIVLRRRWNRNIKTKMACFTSDTTYMFMVVIFGLGIYKTDMCVQKQLSVYTQECAVYKISWGGWAGWGGILSTLKN